MLTALGLYLTEKQTSLVLSSQVSDQKLELTALVDQINQLELDKASSVQIIGKLGAEQRSLQAKLDLQQAELAAASEALREESELLQQANAQRSLAEEKLLELNHELVESARKLQASSQAGKIAQLQERIQDLETTNIQLQNQLNIASEQSREASAPWPTSSMIKPLCLLLLAVCSFLLSGCFNATVDEQSVPWGRPASWERGAPGFGTGY